jgi:three-Cys-motif partner protein
VKTEEKAIPGSKRGPADKWKCNKLESFSDFISSYKALSRKAAYCYLELFSGPGLSVCDGMDCFLEDSSLRALKSQVRFSRYGFLTQSRKKADLLHKAIEPYHAENAEILVGNPNSEKVILRLLDLVPRSASGLVYIDPGGYRGLDWEVLERIARHGQNWRGEKLDLLIVFPLEMALLRNLMRPECQNSVARFYGNHQWEDIKREKNVRKWGPEDIRRRLVELYKAGLFGLGYRHVEDYKPSSPTYEPYYHIIYAGDASSRLKDIKSAWGRSRFLKCELLYGIGNKIRIRK